MAELKTLNGYEIVDQSCRDRVTTLEKNTSIKVDTYLNGYSTNSVQNKIIFNEFNKIRNIYFPGYAKIKDILAYTKQPYTDNQALFIILVVDISNINNYYFGIICNPDTSKTDFSKIDIAGNFTNCISEIIFTQPPFIGGATIPPYNGIYITATSEDMSIIIMNGYSR